MPISLLTNRGNFDFFPESFCCRVMCQNLSFSASGYESSFYPLRFVLGLGSHISFMEAQAKRSPFPLSDRVCLQWQINIK